jgi:hypothetical protein
MLGEWRSKWGSYHPDWQSAASFQAGYMTDMLSLLLSGRHVETGNVVASAAPGRNNNCCCWQKKENCPDFFGRLEA